MLTLHYYSNSEGIRFALRQVAAWYQEDDVYNKDLIKEFEDTKPAVEKELADDLAKGDK